MIFRKTQIQIDLMKHLLFFAIFTVSGYLSFGQETKKLDCSSLKQGVFKYLDIEDTTAYFEINESRHIEHHQNGKYTIKSKLEWVNDCRYSMTMLSNTIPGFPFKPGDVMLVTINKIDGNIIYYTSEVNKQTWDGRLLKIK